MKMLKASELAEALELTPGRISQLVSEGKLDGAFSGAGRDRRFDLIKSAELLGRRLDIGQRLGNGARSERARQEILAAGAGGAQPPSDMTPAAASGASAAAPTSLSDYERARTEKAQEEARRMRRLNAEAEGMFVLADEVARQVRRQIGQEVSEVATYIRDTSRVLADRFDVDARAVRQVMLDQWRAHRGVRADLAQAAGAAATMSQAESAADI
jgi:hypothetical protein